MEVWQGAHSHKRSRRRQCVSPTRKLYGAKFSKADSSTFAHLVWQGNRTWATVAIHHSKPAGHKFRQSNCCCSKCCWWLLANLPIVSATISDTVAAVGLQGATNRPATAHLHHHCRCCYPNSNWKPQRCCFHCRNQHSTLKHEIAVNWNPSKVKFLWARILRSGW